MTRIGKKCWGFCLLAIGLVVQPGVSSAASVHLASDTLLRVFERNGKTVVPGYEFLQVDAGSLENKGLSFHLSGWGRTDLADAGFYPDTSNGDLLYGYLEYTLPMNNVDLKLGRFYVFSGVAHDSVDGARVAFDLTPYFTVSAYGGAPPALDSEQGRGGDSIVGGRIAHHLGALYDIGVSYKKVNNDGAEQEQMLGVDLNAALPFKIGLSGYSAYNIRTDGWAEHSYEVRFAVADLSFRPFFSHFRYEDYFGTGVYSASPFIRLAGTDRTITSYGTDILWRKYSQWDIGVRFKGNSYDGSDTDTAYYTSGLLTWRGANMTQIGGELGYMDGDLDRDRYLLSRAYFYWDKGSRPWPVQFITGDLVYAYYDRSLYSEHNALFLSLGVGSNFLKKALQIKLSGDYSSDPYFDNDLRGLVSARYTFDM